MLTLRSILFTPGDSEKKIARGLETQADAVILDLEDSVAPTRKEEARKIVTERLKKRAGRKNDDGKKVWVRINALTSDEAQRDIAEIVAGAPDAIVLPKANSARDVEHLHDHISVHEAKEGLIAGSIGIVPIATETPASLFGLSTYGAATPRLAAMTWGAEDLSSAIGAFSNVDDDGNLTPLYVMARSLCLAAAAHSQVLPIDAAYMNFKDLKGLKKECAAARRDGFRAKLAIHPAQVEEINAAFTPAADEVANARKIVKAFEESPDAGVVQINGAMIDRPHLTQAQHILNVNELYSHNDG